MTESELLAVPVPNATDSYAPVAHEDIINQVEQFTSGQGITIKKKQYNTNKKGTQVIGLYDMTSHISGFDFRVAFRNSYDKTMSLAFVAGASVMICSNGMVVGETQFIRKHTGSVKQEMKSKVEVAFDDYVQVMNQVKNDSEKMKNIKTNPTAIAELCGRFFMEQEIITSSQLNIIKREINNPTFQEFSEANLWSLYNHTTYALKETHPLHFIDSHKKLHEFVSEDILI